MSEKKSSENEMLNELAWASGQLRSHARHGSVKERIRSAARELGWKYSRTKAVWYADDRVSLKAKELRQIEEVTGIAYGRKERAEVDALISKADALLMGNDPDFHGPFVAAIRAFFGALDRSRTQGD